MGDVTTERTVCAACGAESEQPTPDEAAATGSPDLDTRPAEPVRSTLDRWVQRCPSCGYCAASLSLGPPSVARMVAAAGYRVLLDDPARPALANRFLCASVVLERGGAVGEAGWQAVYAAWACDDAGPDAAEEAAACRMRAVEMFDLAVRVEQAYAGTPAEQDAVCADLLRRAGRFDDAVARCEAAVAAHGDAAGLAGDVLRYEFARAAARDAGARTLAEAGAHRGAAS